MGSKEIQEEYYLLGLDVSTKTIGVSLFNNKGELLELTHNHQKLNLYLRVKPRNY